MNVGEKRIHPGQSLVALLKGLVRGEREGKEEGLVLWAANEQVSHSPSGCSKKTVTMGSVRVTGCWATLQQRVREGRVTPQLIALKGRARTDQFVKSSKAVILSLMKAGSNLPENLAEGSEGITISL